MFVRRLLFVLTIGLIATLAACGPSVPAAVQTAAPAVQTALPTGLPTVNVPAAIQTAVPAIQTALPTIPSAVQTAPAAAQTAIAGTVSIKLSAESNSGETGSAVLTEVGGKTTVVVTVTGQPAGSSQPMHIHEGGCGPTLGKVVFTLTPLANGVSTTTVDTTIANLKSGKFAINGHKSSSEMSTYVFCGNISQ